MHTAIDDADTNSPIVASKIQTYSSALSTLYCSRQLVGLLEFQFFRLLSSRSSADAVVPPADESSGFSPKRQTNDYLSDAVTRQELVGRSKGNFPGEGGVYWDNRGRV